MTEIEPKVCKRCGQLIIANVAQFDVFEGMHWLCFHLEFEHHGDADVACGDISCPWFRIEALSKALRERGVDPTQVLTDEYQRRARGGGQSK